jgi:hypothetical protein
MLWLKQVSMSREAGYYQMKEKQLYSWMYNISNKTMYNTSNKTLTDRQRQALRAASTRVFQRGTAVHAETLARYSSVEFFNQDSAAFFSRIETYCATPESQHRFRAGRNAVMTLYRYFNGGTDIEILPENIVDLESQVGSFYIEFIASNKGISADEAVIALCVSELFILNTSESTGKIVLGKMAFASRPHLAAEYDQLSDDGKAYFNDVIVPLAAEYAVYILLTSPSVEVQEWQDNLKATQFDISNNETLRNCIARVMKLSSAIADFIHEKNIQDEKEIKLLEKRREELAGFKLPAALRRAIADRLGLNPEDLDPAVARKAAEITTG